MGHQKHKKRVGYKERVGYSEGGAATLGGPTGVAIAATVPTEAPEDASEQGSAATGSQAPAAQGGATPGAYLHPP
eukprot:11179039-Lingulodinium_polyedra.AAC.1